MSTSPNNYGRATAVNALLFGCTAFLAAEPALWLVRSWFDAALGSDGELVFAGVLALFVWSASSRLERPVQTALPAVLFALTALVRVGGHMLDVNVIGALALVIDAYALCLMFGVQHRERALSPLWLSVLFGLALPLERIIQRVVGYGLQQISAAGACGALSVGFDDVACHGTNIILRGVHVLVDLPCSGARGLLLIAAAFAIIAALTRPTSRWAVTGAATALLAALVANTLRISILAIGIAFREAVGFDVMAQPWHDAIGLLCLGLGLAAIVAWSSFADSTRPPTPTARIVRQRPPPAGPLIALLLGACILVSIAPAKPVDIGRPMPALTAPAALAGTAATSIPLRDREKAYFLTYGGAAAKAQYGARTVLLVSTSAPLRHLHAPEECLGGAGYEVQRLGISYGALPGAHYRAVAPDGTAWRVIVSYRSDAGHTATSISEAVWLWLKHPNTTWTAIERAHPWDAPLADNERFDADLGRSLNFQTTPNDPETT